MSAEIRTVAEWLAKGRRELVEARDRRPELELQPREASLILGHALGWNDAQVRARDDREVSSEVGRIFLDGVSRRAGGEPMAYVLGSKEFYGRDFRVDSRVLIPRPETEHLVELALQRLESVDRPRILDVGTGSGCIALTLACERPDASVVATDLSLPALMVAESNAKSLGVEDRTALVRTSLTEGLKLQEFDAVVSNPPYVAPEASAEMSPGVLDFEPHTALFAPDQGRRLISELLDSATRLRPGIPLLMELGYDQGDWALNAVARRRHLAEQELIRDYAGLARILTCCRVSE